MVDNCRKLQLDDLDQYRALMLRAYAESPDSFTATVEERKAAPDGWWLKRIADPVGFHQVIGATADGQLVGAVALDFSKRPKTRHKAQLIGLYVAPEARVRGVGRQLVEAAVERCRLRPEVRVIQLTVTEGNTAAIGLYRCLGFEVFGVEPLAMQSAAGYLAKVHLWLELPAS